LYRASIVRVAGPDETQVRAQVMRTVAHEVAHHFGISDDRLREIDAY
jgi:predicted Zn-dependent protease with MMP-like domain